MPSSVSDWLLEDDARAYSCLAVTWTEYFIFRNCPGWISGNGTQCIVTTFGGRFHEKFLPSSDLDGIAHV